MKFTQQVENEDDGPYIFLIDGQEVGRTCYDSHGGQGMMDMIDLFRQTAEALGQQVEEEEEFG